MNYKQRIKIHNRFDIEVRDATTGELKQKGLAENIVLDSMYSRLTDFAGYFHYIHFGTGMGTPSPERVSLFQHLGTKAATDYEKIDGFTLGKYTRVIQLNPEEYIDETLTEVGIAWGSASTNLVTHAMIKDSEGNSITLTKSNLDVILIYATVFITLNGTADISFGIDSSGLMEYLLGDAIHKDTPRIGYMVGMLNVVPGGVALPPAQYAFTNTKDVPNKTVVLSASRLPVNDNPIGKFAITRLNYAYLALSARDQVCGYLASVHLGSYRFSDEPIGIGDGETTVFSNFWTPILDDNFTLKIDGVVVSPSEYSIVHNSPKLENYNLMYGLFFDIKDYGTSNRNTMAVGIAGYTASNTCKLKIRVDDLTRTVGINQITAFLQSGTLYAYIQKFNSTERLLIGQVYRSSSGTIMTITSSATMADWADCEYLHLESNTFWYLVGLTPLEPLSTVLTNDILVFNTPPIDGAVITADYTIEGLPKTEDYVIDSSLTLQFGEGV